MEKSVIEKFCEKYNISPEKFKPAPISKEERIDEIEECIIELAEILGDME